MSALEAADCLWLGDLGAEHHQGQGKLHIGCLQSGQRNGPVYLSDALHDGNSALDQLFILQLHVNHQVAVDVSQTGHGAGGKHIANELLRRAGLEARGSG